MWVEYTSCVATLFSLVLLKLGFDQGAVYFYQTNLLSCYITYLQHSVREQSLLFVCTYLYTDSNNQTTT